MLPAIMLVTMVLAALFSVRQDDGERTAFIVGDQVLVLGVFMKRLMVDC
jgi:hypothetical protein